MAISESSFIFGIHEEGGERHMAEMGRKGWILFTEGLGSDPNNNSSRDYSRWGNDGYGVIVRLNNGYNPAGTIPHPDHYENFARRCGNFVRASRGANIWIIGNEMNYTVEWPGASGARGDLPGVRDLNPETIYDRLRALPQRFSALHPDLPLPRGELGDMITPQKYARCYTLCRQSIKSVPGHENDQVLIGAVAPWNDNAKYPGNPNGDWVQYQTDILQALGPNGCDGITIHTYTHGTDPNLIHDASRMNPPFQNRYYQFLTYRDLMEGIPATMRHLPVYLTEMDQNDPWHDGNNGWIKRAYGELHWWNQQPGKQQIRAAILYRWPRIDRWVIEGKNGVIADFREALQNDYRWDPRAVSAPRPEPVLPPQPLTPADFKRGETLITATVVNLRRTPGVAGKPADDVVAQLPKESRVTLSDGPRTVDNLVWWQVSGELNGLRVEGWSAQSVAANAPLLTRPAAPVGAFAAGDTISTLTTIRLRRTPGFQNKPADDVLGELPMDGRANVVSGPQSLDGLTWWQVRARTLDGELLGWLAQSAFGGQDLIAKATAPVTAAAHRQIQPRADDLYLDLRQPTPQSRLCGQDRRGHCDGNPPRCGDRHRRRAGTCR